MKNLELTLGLVGGLAIGAVVGILLAPDKGQHTRRRILEYAKSIIQKEGAIEEHLAAEFQKFVEKISAKYKLTQTELEKIWEEAKVSIADAKTEIVNN